MEFQTGLPYAADSGLSVVLGLDVTGTPIFQRPGDWRILPVDLYTLLQGVIERCLATKQADGSFLVSPTIYDEDMTSTDDGIPYRDIATWIERTYPGGVLHEVRGYAKNLLDLWPANLILQAIDDKIWALGNSGVTAWGAATGKSVFGNLKDTAPFWEAFADATAIMTQAGVDFDPVTNQMVLVPARVTGGDPVYGAPSEATRIYPEMLLARYKVLREMRYKQASIYETRRELNSDTADPAQTFTQGQANGTDPDAAWAAALETQHGRFTLHEPPAAEDNLGDLTPAAYTAWWTLGDGEYRSWAYAWGTWYVTRDLYMRAPQFKIFRGYEGIEHEIKVWGLWGGGDKPLDMDLVVGKNLIASITAGESDPLFSLIADMKWPADNVKKPWEPPYPGNAMYSYSLLLDVPVEDWEFAFCREAPTWEV